MYTAKITVEINGENGTKETQTIVIPFTIANPTTESAAYFAESVLIQLRIQAVDFYLKADTAFFRIISVSYTHLDVYKRQG